MDKAVLTGKAVGEGEGFTEQRRKCRMLSERAAGIQNGMRCQRRQKAVHFHEAPCREPVQPETGLRPGQRLQQTAVCGHGKLLTCGAVHGSPSFRKKV